MLLVSQLIHQGTVPSEPTLVETLAAPSVRDPKRAVEPPNASFRSLLITFYHFLELFKGFLKDFEGFSIEIRAGPSSLLDLIDSKGPETASSMAEKAGASRARLFGDEKGPESTESKAEEEKSKRSCDLRSCKLAY